MTFQKSNFYTTRVYICFCQKKNLHTYFFVMLKGLKASNIVLLLIHYLCTKETKKILLILLVLKIVFSNKYFSRKTFLTILPSGSVSSMLSLPIAIKCFNLSNTDFRLVKLGGGLLISRSLNLSSASEKCF